jgi:FdhD protein
MTATMPIAPDPDAYADGWMLCDGERFDGAAAQTLDDKLIEEIPVALYYNDEPHAVLMATPTALEAFAVGFTLSERIVASVADIGPIDVAPTGHGAAIFITITHPIAGRLAATRRNLVAPGGCGLCGTEDLLHAGRVPDTLAQYVRFTPQAVATAMAALRERQVLSAATGGAHAAGFASTTGVLAEVVEDAGRHNALDKLIGVRASSGAGFSGGFVVITSRASVELVQKAATVGVEALIAISAPTALAVRVARACRMTLIAFARDGRFTCYSETARITRASE